MAEAIHCPSCTTRYRLRPERLKPVIRRAKCFSCGGVFPVGDVVQRLLGTLPTNDLPELALDIADVDIEGVEIEEPALHPEVESMEDSAPTLTLGDLDVADEEILDKTLVTVPESFPETKIEVAPAPVMPEPTPAPAPVPVPVAAAPAPTAAAVSFPPEITETTLSGYTSARDAIAKLFGDAPFANAKTPQDRGATDVEATLSALESTLGASPALAEAGTSTLGDSPTASGLTEEDLSGPSTSTMRLTQDDLQAILDSAPAAAPATASAEPTVALRASDLMAAKAMSHPVPAQTFSATLPESPDSGPGSELLRLKIGEDIYGGLTMPQLIAWVEEGRILENHLVARQHSENWLEAHKVPGLRPVFERLRRERSGGAPSLNMNAEIGEIAPKKSLFGGLFGKG